MGNPLWMRLREEQWDTYGVDAKEGKKINNLLQELAGRKELKAMKASQKLWILLKPGAAVGTAVLPYLKEIRGISSPAVRGEIDDLIRRCE